MNWASSHPGPALLALLTLGAVVSIIRGEIVYRRITRTQTAEIIQLDQARRVTGRLQ